MKIRKNATRKSAKAKCDRLFSKLIRLRDCKNVGQCCTCSEPLTYETCDAGHFISRDNEATRFDQQNAHAQCRACNRFKGGKQFEHAQFIDKKYGEGTAEKILQKSKMRCFRTIIDYEFIAESLKEKLTLLE